MSERDGDASGRSPYARVVVVELVGEIDLASAGSARETLKRAIDEGPSDQLVVDLAMVTFMDCSGLTVLVEVLNTLQDRLLLRNPSRVVARLLDLTDLRQTFTIEIERT